MVVRDCSSSHIYQVYANDTMSQLQISLGVSMESMLSLKMLVAFAMSGYNPGYLIFICVIFRGLGSSSSRCVWIRSSQDKRASLNCVWWVQLYIFLCFVFSDSWCGFRAWFGFNQRYWFGRLVGCSLIYTLDWCREYILHYFGPFSHSLHEW